MGEGHRGIRDRVKQGVQIVSRIRAARRDRSAGQGRRTGRGHHHVLVERLADDHGYPSDHHTEHDHPAPHHDAAPEAATGLGVEEIRAGSQIADVELRQALSSARPPALVPAFAVGETASGLLGALFPVEAPSGPDPNNSYGRWLSRQPKRHVQD